jgi:hypothetical protein
VEREGARRPRASAAPPPHSPFPLQASMTLRWSCLVGVLRWVAATPPHGTEDAHCGFDGGVIDDCADYVGTAMGGEAQVQWMTDVWASKTMLHVVGVGGLS